MPSTHNNHSASASKSVALSKPTNGKTSPSLDDPHRVDKQILDLLCAPVSPNRIQAHLKNAFREDRKAYAIRKVLKRQRRRIRDINGKFDVIAALSLKIFEIDETFKGRRVSLLVVVDSWSGYIFHLAWLGERSKEAILTQLSPIKGLFQKAALVMTDGAPYFPAVVTDLCPKAKHQICLVHVVRNLLPFLRSARTPYSTALSNVKELRGKIETLQQKQNIRSNHLKKLKQQLKYWEEKRDEARQRYGVVARQRGIYKLYPELKTLNDKINERKTKIRSMKNTKQKAATKIKALKMRLKQNESAMNQMWGKFMVQCRTLHDFLHLFDLKKEDYPEARQKFIQRLQKKSSELAAEILKTLTSMKNLDSVKRPDSPIRIKKNFINTNMVEGINSRIRPYLENLRKIVDSEYCGAYFDLIRLYLNTTRPFSGFRRDSSPIERLGYDLRSRTYLDLIYDGFPPGPQYGIQSAQMNITVVSPSRARGCKLVLESGG